MSLEIVAGLLGSQLVRAVASEIATTLACQAIQHAVGTMAQPRTDSRGNLSRGSATAATRPDAADEAALPELRALPTVEVLSAVPGRTRLRVQGLRDDAARAAEAVANVRALEGVRSAEASSLTGALLVRFDPEQISVAGIVAALEPPMPARTVRAAERAPYLRLVVG